MLYFRALMHTPELFVHNRLGTTQAAGDTFVAHETQIIIHFPPQGLIPARHIWSIPALHSLK